MCWSPFDLDFDFDRETAKVVIDALAALGTVAVAIMAIWGERIRASLAPPKAALQLHTPHGAPALMRIPGVGMPGGGKPAHWYHLKVVNDRPWLTIQNCRVLLRGVRRRVADGSYSEVAFPVPFPYIWSGLEPAPDLVTIAREPRVVDFGALIEGEDAFKPRLVGGPNLFDGFVRKGEAVRYELVVDASNFPAGKPQVFEVTWEGEYPVVTEVSGR